MNIYNNLGYWFLLLIVLAFAGFYTSYLSVIFQTNIPIIHVHFTLMTLWMVMLATQPFLIKYRKLSIHRIVGKISYVLVPLVLLSGFLMIRHAYYRDIDRLSGESLQGLNQFSNAQIIAQVAAGMALPFIWFFWFILFYILAIINRGKSAVHARYMLATALSLLGPIVDRIVFRMITASPSVRPESVAFIIADVSILLLLIKDYRDNRPAKTMLTSLLIYIIGQGLYFALPGTAGWQFMATLMMKPTP